MQPVSRDGWDKVEQLVAELRAIELWDTSYWRNARPDVYETISHAARQERRAEILSHLLSLTRDWTNEQDDDSDRPPRCPNAVLPEAYRTKGMQRTSVRLHLIIERKHTEGVIELDTGCGNQQTYVRDVHNLVRKVKCARR